MTLIVSLRTPDGIVLAGDSLATMVSNIQVGADLSINCPKCGHGHTSNHTIDLPPAPATTLSYAQKIFPFMEQYAMGTFGAGSLVGKTIHFAIRELEKQPPGGISTVKEAAVAAGEHIHGLLTEELRRLNNGAAKRLAKDVYPLGLQVVGYEDGIAKTIVVQIGNELKFSEQTGPGITASGETSVLQALGEIYERNEESKPMYDLFSLQDAIEYAEFAISTTTSFQHFSRTIPTVGGDVDIALVTPFDPFEWIKRKSLQSRLIGR